MSQIHMKGGTRVQRGAASAAALVLLAVAGGSAQQPGPAPPTAAAAPAPAAVAPQSGLASLFGTYTVRGDWGAAKGAPAWGGTTTWLAADGKGTVVVLVRTPPHFRFYSTDGTFVRSWGDKGLFNEAHSVHFGPDGAVWATDSNDHVVRKFSPEGQLLLTLGKKGASGDNTSRELFNRPNAVAFGPGGDIYVSDGYQNQRIVQFKPDGAFVRIIGGTQGKQPGQMNVVHGVAIDPQGRVIVNDSDNQRLTIFDKDGTFQKTIAVPSRGGVFAGADGTIYVSDVNSGAVVIIRNDQIVDFIKVEGRPHGLAVDPTTGDVYTSSTVGNRPGVTKATLRRSAAR